MPVNRAREGFVLIVTLDRQERLNALTGPDYVELAEIWRRTAYDDSVRAIVLTGAGERAFCTGADLYDTIPKPPPVSGLWGPMGNERVDRGLITWKPVIAAIRGFCIGGGLTLAMNADLRVAGADARFSLPEARWGIPANTDPARLGAHAPAMEWMLGGAQFGAEAALERGFVNRVVEPEQVLPVAVDLAHRVAANPPDAVQATKEVAWRSVRSDTETVDRLEAAFASALHTSAGP